jgi:amidase
VWTPAESTQATTNLARWLTDDYKRSANEVAIVLGSASKCQIAEVVDPRVHVVATIDKKTLAGLQP